VSSVITADIEETDLGPFDTRSALRRGSARRLVVCGAFLAGSAVLVAVLYAAAVHAFTGDSDGATVVLEGQAMGAGHLMLHGWSLSLDSFWTVDAIFYTLVELATGLTSTTLYLVPAIIAALVIAVGALLAGYGRRGVARVAAGATVVTLLALPSHTLAIFFLRGPLHVGTVLWCLIAFAGLRSGRFGWGFVAAVLFFAAGLLGDFQMLGLGILPACAGGLIAMLRARDWRSGAPTVLAASAALVLAALVREIADTVGTFSVANRNPSASPSQTLTNLGHIGTWGAQMLGVGSSSYGSGGVPAQLGAVHALGLLTVVAGVVVAAVALVKGIVRGDSGSHGAANAQGLAAEWRIDDLLVLAFVSDLVVFVLLSTSNDPGFMRYLTGAVVFGTILAGRLVGRLATAQFSTRQLRGLALIGLAVVAAFAGALVFTVTAARPTSVQAQLGHFLEARDLREGIGDYWSASITTVATGGAVRVRPVITTPQGVVVRYERQSSDSWYAGRSFGFLVYDTARPWGGIGSATASATFGAVRHTYAVGSYRVLVWSHPLSVPTAGFAPVSVSHAKAMQVR